MDFPCQSSVEPLKNAVFKTLREFVILWSLLFMGCNSSIFTGGIAEHRIENVIPELLTDPVAHGISVNQMGPEVMVTLPYTSRGAAVPSTCSLDSLVGIVEVTSCACAGGTCRAGIQAQMGVYGEGSFNFRLMGTGKVPPSNTGSMRVRILPVTISVVSGDGQEGVVGTKLSSPLVALVQNSDKVPVSGVKVYWKVPGEGETSSCTEISDRQGLAQCDLALGTKVSTDEVRATFYIEASIFDKVEIGPGGGHGGPTNGSDSGPIQDFQKPAPAQFSAVVKSGPVAQLVFSPEKYPKDGVSAGMNLGEIVIYPRDAHGNLAEVGRALEVTLSFGEKPDGVNLGEKREMPLSWKGGAFSGDENLCLSADKALRGALCLTKVGPYSLVASSTGLTQATGGKFEVIPGEAKQLAFTKQPGGGLAGATWAKQPEVTVQDIYGNNVTSSVEVKKATGEDPKVTIIIYEKSSGSSTILLPKGRQLGGIVDGVARFIDLSFDRAGSYELTATCRGLKWGSSNPFPIGHGRAEKLKFTTLPEGAVIGTAFTTQPVVTIQDKYGNPVVSGADAGVSLTMSLATGTGVLSGTKTVAARSGVSSWSTLSIDASGSKTLKVEAIDASGSITLKVEGGTGPLSATSKVFNNRSFTITSATPGNGKVVLVWEKALGAASYTVKYGTGSNSYPSSITGLTETSATVTELTNGTAYYFMVTAVYNDSTPPQDANAEIISTPALLPRSAITD